MPTCLRAIRSGDRDLQGADRSRNDGNLPLDGVLVQLGRAYAVAGKRTEARQTFTRVVDQFPNSPYLSDTRRELERLDEAATG